MSLKFHVPPTIVRWPGVESPIQVRRVWALTAMNLLLQFCYRQHPAEVSTFMAYSENRLKDHSNLYLWATLRTNGFTLSHFYFHASSHLGQLLFYFYLEG